MRLQDWDLIFVAQMGINLCAVATGWIAHGIWNKRRILKAQEVWKRKRAFAPQRTTKE